jgi:hypothetical protein
MSEIKSILLKIKTFSNAEIAAQAALEKGAPQAVL